MNIANFFYEYADKEDNVSLEEQVFCAVSGSHAACQEVQSDLKKLADDLESRGEIATFQALNETRWLVKKMGEMIDFLNSVEQKKQQYAIELLNAQYPEPSTVVVGKESHIDIYTDGACIGNPGPGGWAALLRGPDGERELVGSDTDTTNNRMEMMGAIMALEALPETRAVTLYSDSQYLIKGITEWFGGWVQNGWRTSSGEPVKNADLWGRLHTARLCHNVRWQWVKGHAGNPGNERVDALANAAAERVLMDRIDNPPTIHNTLEKEA